MITAPKSNSIENSILLNDVENPSQSFKLFFSEDDEKLSFWLDDSLVKFFFKTELRMKCMKQNNS